MARSVEILSDINRSVAQKSLGTPAVAVKIHTQAASLYMPQGSKHGKKVAACSPAITVLLPALFTLCVINGNWDGLVSIRHVARVV